MEYIGIMRLFGDIMHVIAFGEGRPHEDDAVHFDETQYFVVQEQRRHEDVGQIFREMETLHELIRRQSALEGRDERLQFLRADQGDAISQVLVEDLADEHGRAARQNDVLDLVALDQRPQGRQRAINIFADRRREGQVFALALREIIPDA